MSVCMQASTSSISEHLQTLINLKITHYVHNSWNHSQKLKLAWSHFLRYCDMVDTKFESWFVY